MSLCSNPPLVCFTQGRSHVFVRTAVVALHGLPPTPNAPLPFPSYFLLPCAHLAPATPAFLLHFTQAPQGPASGSLYLMLFSQITTSLQSLSLGTRSQ